MSATPPSITARTAVAAYRREPMLARSTRDDAALGRLEADPDGKVSAALARLRPASCVLVLLYALQAADLALSVADVTTASAARADEYQRAAEDARRLRAFCEARAPMHLWVPLADLSVFLDDQAHRVAARPGRLQIKRTQGGKHGPAILALRHLGRRLRDELKIAHPDHSALAWLIESTLGLERPLPAHVVADALRMGVRAHAKAPNSQSLVIP